MLNSILPETPVTPLLSTITPRRTLIADDQPDVLVALKLLLKGEGIETESVTSPDAVIEALSNRRFDLILMDLNYARDTTSGQEGLDLIARIRAIDRYLPIVAMTAWGSIEVAVEAMRRGIDDFILKPWQNRQLVQLLDRLMEMGRARRFAAQEQARRQKEREQELLAASNVQKSLLPQQIPPLSGCEMATAWLPAREVGGDYFDVIRFNDQLAAFCIGDVAGKGMSAALTMSSLQALVKAFASALMSPAEICLQLNRQLCQQHGNNKLITFFYCLYDNKNRRLTYSNAGHNPPFLVRKDGTVMRLAEGGLLLGAFPQSIYFEQDIELCTGDKLLLFTDGITEAQDSNGEEFGEERLCRMLIHYRHIDLSQLRDQIMEVVSVFSNNEIKDDSAMLLLEVI